MTVAVASRGESEAATGTVPDWLAGGDLVVCKVLQEMSAQIVATCRSFSAELEGVCKQASDKLPPGEAGEGSSVEEFDCADDCFSFLDGFTTFSRALFQLAGDLENAVTQPLQTTIATMMEERMGRMKHIQQVRTHFAELQERYSKSRQRSLEARKLLQTSPRESNKSWGWTRSPSGRLATEQHAALQELAHCEEELLQSEASLRELENQSKERLQELEHEKRALLRGVLAQGTGFLKRLLPSADKRTVPATDEWQGVVPRSSAQQATVGRGEAIESNCSSSKLRPPAADARSQHDTGSLGENLADGKVASVDRLPLGTSQELDAKSADPSQKYLQNSKASSEFSALAEVGMGEDPVSDPELADAAVRAIAWSPPVRPTGTQAPKPKQRSLVFQSTGASLVAESRIHERKPASRPMASAAMETSAGDLFFTGPAAPKSKLMDSERSISSSRSMAALHSRGIVAGSSAESVTGQLTVGSASSSSSTAAPQTNSGKSSRPAPLEAEVLEDKDISDDDECQSGRSLAPITKPDLAFDLSPLVAENPQKCFERYLHRLHEQLASATETSWARLQAKASEQILEGHVGKLNFFWLHQKGAKACPETADGLVCFQFVQGCASNFARILHLSVAEDGAATPGQQPHQRQQDERGKWNDTLPSAILEVRRFVFGTLPVDSLRAVMVAGQDGGSGPIYVDRQVEAAYKCCRFKWFQLTQNIHRTRSRMLAKKTKMNSRFLVLHVSRGPDDPLAPRSAIECQPALLFKDSPQSFEEGAAEKGDAPCAGFSAW